MKRLDPRAAAAAATSPNPTRPATALLHDVPDARLVVFRIGAGQEVAPHRSTSTVIMTIAAGQGFVSDEQGEHAVRTGEVIAYEPNELHGMRAADEELIVLATITPRPGAR